MKKIIFFLLFSSITVLSFAQYTRGGGGAFSFGVQTWPTEGLEAFAPDGPGIQITNFSWGGYGYWQYGDWTFGLKGAGIYGSESIDDTYVYSMDGGYFSLDLGYKVINRPKFFLYPFAGVGLGGVSYSIDEKSSIDLADPNNDTPAIYGGTYNWNQVVFDAGVRLEQLFGLKQKEEEVSGGLVGVELGYMFSPTSSDWRTNTKATIINAPEYSMNGLYARVTIGGFGGY